MDITQSAIALMQVRRVYKARWETPEPAKRRRRFRLRIPFAPRPLSRPLKPRLS